MSYSCPDPSDEEMHSASNEPYGRERENETDIDYELFDII